MILGNLTSWAGDHGVITSNDGCTFYCSLGDWPRSLPPVVGLRVAFEIVPEELPQGAVARAVLVVLAGDANG